MSERFRYTAEERAAIVAALPAEWATLTRHTADPEMMLAELETCASALVGKPKAPRREINKHSRDGSRRVVRAADEMLDALAEANRDVPGYLQPDAPLIRALLDSRASRLEHVQQLTEDLGRSRKEDETRETMLALAVACWEHYGGRVRFGDGSGPLGRFLGAVVVPVIGQQRAGSPEALAAAARKAWATITLELHFERDLEN